MVTLRGLQMAGVTYWGGVGDNFVKSWAGFVTFSYFMPAAGLHTLMRGLASGSMLAWAYRGWAVWVDMPNRLIKPLGLCQYEFSGF